MNTKRLIIILGLAGFIVMADNWVVSPLLPAIARSFGVEPVRAGILIAAYMLPFGLFQLVYGPLADRFGKLKVISVSLALFTVATTLCGFGLGLSDLTGYRALTGAFAAAVMPVGLALIGDLVPMKDRQQAIAMFMGIAFFGQAVSMTIGGIVAYVSSWRGVFWIYGLASVAVTVLVVISTRSVRSELRGNPQSEFLRPYGRLLRHGASLRTYLVTLVEGGLILGSFSYLGAESAQSLGLSNLKIGLLMAIFGVGVIAGSRLAGPLSARMGRRMLVVAGLVSAAAADLLVASAPTQILLTAIALLLLGLGFMLAHSSLLTTVTGFAQKARGTAMSLVAFCFMVGGSLGTLSGGRLIDAFGFGDFYLASAISLLVLAGIGLAVLPRTAAVPAEVVEQGRKANSDAPTFPAPARDAAAIAVHE